MTLILSGTSGLSDVDGSAATPAIRGTDANTGIFFPAADTIAFAEGGAEIARFDSSGNFGIGTSSPATILDVVGSGNPTLTLRGSAGAYTSFLKLQAAGGGGSAIDATGATSDSLQFRITGTERMRIDSSGNLLVGTTSTIDTIENLQVVNNSAQQMLVRNSSATGGSYWKFGADSSNNYTVYSSSGTGGVYLTTSGTSWTARSDERVKDIIEPISDAVNKVSQLRAVIGKYKIDEEGTRRSFLIAQDVQAVLPEAVNVQEDEIGTLGVQYTDVIPLLVAAITEQQAIITQLQADVEALKAQP